MVDLAWRRRLCAFKNFLRGSEVIETPGKITSISISFGKEGARGPEEGREFQTTDGTLDARMTKLEALTKPLPYNRVCSKECTDGICVAWVFENDFLNEPILPLFPLETDTDVREEDDEICLTRRMPGAFED
jgi:hypothetical protein